MGQHDEAKETFARIMARQKEQADWVAAHNQEMDANRARRASFDSVGSDLTRENPSRPDSRNSTTLPALGGAASALADSHLGATNADNNEDNGNGSDEDSQVSRTSSGHVKTKRNYYDNENDESTNSTAGNVVASAKYKTAL